MRRIVLSIISGSALLLSACTVGTTRTQAEPVAFPSGSSGGVGADTSVEDVVEEVLPAVVNVVGDQGEGTGFIVREDGIIVTNFHVVEGASSITVFTSAEEPEEYDARVIGGDVLADLAILDVDARGLPTAPLGDSDDLNLGQQVVALGYALGLEGGPSVTSGIVSSLAREITVPDANCLECNGGERVYTDVIQTDAAINPGNSGGPLVDLAGNVVGINTAGTSAAENVGFAIQINSVKPAIFQAADDPDDPVAFMGIGSSDAGDPEVQLALDPPVDTGALIRNVVPGGPADVAGIELGDVIVGFDGEVVGTSERLGELIRERDPGDEVRVELVRADGSEATVTVRLGVNPVPVT